MTFLFSISATAALAVLLIWIGYPLAIWCVAKMFGKPIVPDRVGGRDRRVSVILATREPAAAIRARIENLLDTTHPASRLEVVVALDAEGARASSNELDAVDPRVRVVVGDLPGGKACALNAGVRVATGDVLVMADTAQRFYPDTIPELVAHLEDVRFGAVSGALELGRAAGVSPVDVYWRLEKWLRHSESVVHSAIGVTGAVYAVERRRFPVLPPGTILDDVYVPMSLVLAGTRIGFTYSARATDIRVFEAAQESNRKTRTLSGVLQLNTLLPQLLTQRNPVRVQYVLHKLARLSTPLWVGLMVTALAGIGMIGAVRYPLEIGGAMAAVMLVLVTVPALRRRSTAGAVWFVTLQLAIVRALRNGMSGEWDVWHQSSRGKR